MSKEVREKERDFDIGTAKAATQQKLSQTPYKVQAEFNLSVDGVTVNAKQGQVITDQYLINKLLAVGAPMQPADDSEMDVIFCPHCKNKIELSSVPAIKDWMKLQK